MGKLQAHTHMKPHPVHVYRGIFKQYIVLNYGSYLTTRDGVDAPWFIWKGGSQLIIRFKPLNRISAFIFFIPPRYNSVIPGDLLSLVIKSIKVLLVFIYTTVIERAYHAYIVLSQTKTEKDDTYRQHKHSLAPIFL